MEEHSESRILLVEDQPIIALAEQRLLEKNGYRVSIAGTGEQAVEMVTNDRDFDLILMDIDLGSQMSGTAAAQAILAFHTLPIVFLSSHSERDYVDTVKEITRYGYVLKSAGEFVLLEAITTALDLFEARSEAERIQAQFQAFMAHFPGAAFLKNHENELLYCNTLYASMLGTTPEALLHTNTNDSLPDELREQYERENRTVLEDHQVLKAESTFGEPEKVSRWLTFKFPVHIQGETLVGGISLNVTERHDPRQSEQSNHGPAHSSNS